MGSLGRRSRSIPRHRRRHVDEPDPLSRLLDDDHVGGLLARIRAVGCLIGNASEIDPAQLTAAGWLIEELADVARARLRDEIERQRSLEGNGGRRA